MAASLPPPPTRPAMPPPAGPPVSNVPPPGGQSWSTLPPPPPPPSRWGFGDVFLGAAVILGFAAIVGVVSAVIVGIPEASDTETASELLADEPAVLVSSVIAQQLAMIGWVVWVARRKGQGVVREFGLRFRWIDLAIGFGTALAAIIVTNVVITALSAWAGVDTVDNAEFIDAPEQGLWIIPIVVMVVIGAPLSEELFFRGLVFRAAEKRWSTAVAIGVSTLAFAVVHVITGVSAAENLILVAGIGIFGVALAVVTAQYRRLGPAIIAHGLINGATVAAILATT